MSHKHQYQKIIQQSRSSNTEVTELERELNNFRHQLHNTKTKLQDEVEKTLIQEQLLSCKVKDIFNKLQKELTTVRQQLQEAKARRIELEKELMTVRQQLQEAKARPIELEKELTTVREQLKGNNITVEDLKKWLLQSGKENQVGSRQVAGN